VAFKQPLREVKDYSAAEQERLRADFARTATRYLSVQSRIVWLAAIGLAIFGISLLLPQWGYRDWTPLIGWGVMCLWMLAVVLVVGYQMRRGGASAKSRLNCPACGNYLLGVLGAYCPECGQRELQPGLLSGAGRPCTGCGKTLKLIGFGDASSSPNYAVCACSHCGLMLNKQGIGAFTAKGAKEASDGRGAPRAKIIEEAGSLDILVRRPFDPEALAACSFTMVGLTFLGPALVIGVAVALKSLVVGTVLFIVWITLECISAARWARSFLATDRIRINNGEFEIRYEALRLFGTARRFPVLEVRDVRFESNDPAARGRKDPCIVAVAGKKRLAFARGVGSAEGAALAQKINEHLARTPGWIPLAPAAKAARTPAT